MIIADKRLAIVEKDFAKIPLGKDAKDGYALVDLCDKWIEKYKWRLMGKYAKSDIGGKVVYMHHLIAGKPSSDSCVDHINRDKLDNRRSNLRITSHSLNRINKNTRVDNKTGHSGIFLFRNNKYLASIYVNSKRYHVGYFDTVEEAVNARKNKVKELSVMYSVDIIA